MNPRIAIVAALLLSNAVLFAQPGLSYDTSIEAKVALADNVFVGTISGCSKSTLSPPWTNAGKGETGPFDGAFQYTLTLRANDTIKGKADQTVTWQTGSMDGGQTNLIEEWAAAHERLLCLVNNNESNNAARRALPRWTVIRLGRPTSAEQTAMAHWLGAASPEFTAGETQFVAPPLFTMDFSALTNADSIIDIARRIAGERLITTNLLRLEMGSILDVPITASFENFARGVIQTNDWENQTRAEVVSGLQHFKSPENIEWLKSLLNDPQYWDRYVVGMMWNGRRKYEVRQAAWDVLQGWGVAATRPVTAEKLPWHFYPADRHPLEVDIPVKLFTSAMGPNGDRFSVGSDLRTTVQTNVMVGSNMITGMTCEWFLYPEGEARPAKPARFQQFYSPSSPLEYFSADRGDPIVEGKKFTVEVNYTIFETDNPPPIGTNGPDDVLTEVWRPQDGKNYRALVKRNLRGSLEEKVIREDRVK